MQLTGALLRNTNFRKNWCRLNCVPGKQHKENEREGSKDKQELNKRKKLLWS